MRIVGVSTKSDFLVPTVSKRGRPPLSYDVNSLYPFLMVNPPPFVTMIGGLVFCNTDSRSCSLFLSIPSWMLVNSSIVWPTEARREVRWMNLPTEAHLVFGYRCRVGHRKFLCSLDRAQLDRFRLTDRNNII